MVFHGCIFIEYVTIHEHILSPEQSLIKWLFDYVFD